ncbi:MAG: hypothetical protein AAFQ22_07185 [Pseudomonadota bacterium]
MTTENQTAAESTAADGAAVPESHITVLHEHMPGADDGPEIVNTSGEEAETAPETAPTTEPNPDAQTRPDQAADDGGEGKEKADGGETQELSRTQIRRQQRKEERAKLAREKQEAERALQALKSGLKEPELVDPTKAANYDAAIVQNARKVEQFEARKEQIAAAEQKLNAADGQLNEAGQAEFEAIRQDFNARVDALEAEGISDLRDTLENKTENMSGDTALMLADPDAFPRGPEVAYHLANNPDALARIEGMPSFNRAVELARIEARLPERQSNVKSETPEPLDTVGGKSPPAEKDPDEMSHEEYVAWRGLPAST